MSAIVSRVSIKTATARHHNAFIMLYKNTLNTKHMAYTGGRCNV